MSLVNEMLRDLEKRRAGERHEAGAVFQGLVTTGGARRGNGGLFIVLGLVVVLLGGAFGYLMWARRAPDPVAAPKPEVSHSPAALQVAAPAAQPAMPVTPGFVALEPAPERPVHTAVAPVREETPAPHKHAPEKVQIVAVRSPATPAPVRMAPIPSAAPAATVIEKTPLPPTPQQLAAIAYQKGYEALAAGQREEAERQLREALRNDPEYLRARESLAGLLLAAGRRVEAGEVLESGIKLKPQATSLRQLNARLHVEQGDMAGAVACLEEGAEAAAHDSEYLALLGALYQRQNLFSKSIQRYQQALTIDASQGVWWLGLAISYERAGQKNDALAAYQRALQGGLAEKLASYAGERAKQLDAETKKK